MAQLRVRNQQEVDGLDSGGSGQHVFESMTPTAEPRPPLSLVTLYHTASDRLPTLYVGGLHLPRA